MKGAANVMRHFIPLMKQGTLVNITSGWGRIGAADVSFDVFFKLCFSFSSMFLLLKSLSNRRKCVLRTQLKEFMRGDFS